MPSPIIILDTPQLGDNIGMSARAMKTCLLSELRLINPRDGWPNEKAVVAASGADDVIEGARLFDNVREASTDIHRLYATTGRHRELSFPIMTPDEAIGDMMTSIDEGQNIGILFGGERSGLSNEALLGVDVLIDIPLNPDFKSLNLSHAVMVMSWEWHRHQIIKSKANHKPSNKPSKKIHKSNLPPSKGDVDFLYQRLSQIANDGGYFHNEDMRPIMLQNLRLLLTRAQFTAQDIRTIHGLLNVMASDTNA